MKNREWLLKYVRKANVQFFMLSDWKIVFNWYIAANVVKRRRIRPAVGGGAHEAQDGTVVENRQEHGTGVGHVKQDINQSVEKRQGGNGGWPGRSSGSRNDDGGPRGSKRDNGGENAGGSATEVEVVYKHSTI